MTTPHPTKSAPAPSVAYTELPDFDTVEQRIYAGCRRFISGDMLEPIHDLIREAIDADRASRGQAPAPAAVAVPSETVKFVDESTADPVEKARRYLKAMGDPRMNSAYFFDDGYPRREISQGALATLAVLEQLAAAPASAGISARRGLGRMNDCRIPR